MVVDSDGDGIAHPALGAIGAMGNVILTRISPASHATQDQPPTIRRQPLPSVPLFPASHLVRAAGPNSLEEELCEVPRIVCSILSGTEHFLKAADDRRSFTREVEILGKVRDVGGTSRIAGLVHYDGDETALLGMQLENIEGETLAFAHMAAPAVDKERWADQIQETLGALHERGAVWGALKPENVMVGNSGDAIVVDFGGGFSPGYVDPGLAGMVEGDLQGLRRLRAELLATGEQPPGGTGIMQGVLGHCRARLRCDFFSGVLGRGVRPGEHCLREPGPGLHGHRLVSL